MKVVSLIIKRGLKLRQAGFSTLLATAADDKTEIQTYTDYMRFVKMGEQKVFSAAISCTRVTIF